MTKKERLLQDIQYAIDHKIDRFFIKVDFYKQEGLSVTIHPFCNFKNLKKDLSQSDDNLVFENYRIISWGEFSVHEDKYIKNVVLGNKLGEDIYV